MSAATKRRLGTPTITVTNAGLKPWTSDSFELSIESYHIKDGFGSVGVFQKNITNFFGAVRSPATAELNDLYGLPDDPEYLAYEIATTTNTGDDRIKGFEFSYRQSLTFLPSWARSFQVFVNGTRMTLSGSSTPNFNGFNPSSYAGGINFIRTRYFLKLTCTHQGETRREAIAASATVLHDTFNYQGANTRWGISAQYSLSKQFALYGAMSDLGGGFHRFNAVVLFPRQAKVSSISRRRTSPSCVPEPRSNPSTITPAVMKPKIET